MKERSIIIFASIGRVGALPRATRSSEFQSEDEFFSLFPGSDTGVPRNFSCLQNVFQSTENATKYRENNQFRKIGVDPPILQKLAFFEYFAVLSTHLQTLCVQLKWRATQVSEHRNTRQKVYEARNQNFGWG